LNVIVNNGCIIRHISDTVHRKRRIKDMIIRRRKYLIDASFQMRFILVFVIISLLGSLAAIIVFNYYAMKELDGLMWSIHIRAQSTGEIFKPLFIKINIVSFVLVSVLLTVMALWMIRKASGPVYRMSQDVRKAAKGDLTVNISLRHGDQFKETAQDLDSMMKELRGKFKNINDHYMRISELLPSIGQAENNASVLPHIENIEKELKKFNTGTTGSSE